MLSGYVRLAQDGIESLKDNLFMQKDPNSSHYFFDYCRVALQYHFNPTERLSGMGFLIFAPNGRIWLQSTEYCYELPELASYYFVLDIVLEEAKKSKTKIVELFIPNRQVVKLMNAENPFKEGPYKQIHDETKNKYSQFEKVIITFRNDYPKDVQARLDKESTTASQAPQISTSGRWENQVGNKAYFNVGQTEEDMKQFAEEYARIAHDFIQSYLKEYETDYGKEAVQKLFKDMKEKKVKDLPSTKRVLKEKRESIPVKIKIVPFKKKILCHNCNSLMEFESCTLEKPKNERYYLMRCKHCMATKTLDEKGRLKLYGRYPKKQKT